MAKERGFQDRVRPAKAAISMLQKAWESADMKPAWLHADSKSHDNKVQILKSQKQWKVEADDPQPACTSNLGGRKLGDNSHDSQLGMQRRMPSLDR